jgi:hypothetical protein
MPSRIVREGINSSRAVSSLSEEAQLFYRTLMLVVDDYGRFEIDLDVIRASCFPRQLDRWPPGRIETCLACAVQTLTDDGTPLIQRYRVASKEYLQINNFNQRVQSKPKFPGPPGSVNGSPTVTHGSPTVEHGSPTVDHGSPTVDHGGSPSRASRARTKSYSESNAESKTIENHSSPAGAGDGETDAPASFALEPDAAAAPAKAASIALVTTGWFEEFWSLYWRKDGRQKAQQAFNDRVKTPEDWGRVRRAVIAQTAEMLAREKQHRPHASTWLNQGRMFDEESPPQIRPVRTEDRNQQRRDNVNQLSKALRGRAP